MAAPWALTLDEAMAIKRFAQDLLRREAEVAAAKPSFAERLAAGVSDDDLAAARVDFVAHTRALKDAIRPIKHQGPSYRSTGGASAPSGPSSDPQAPACSAGGRS